MNSNQTFVLSVLNAIIPSISAIIIFYLGNIKEKKVSKSKSLQLRLEKLYIPFYQLYIRGLLNRNKLSEIGTENIEAFIDLFTQNIHYMETITQTYIPSFYLSYINLLEALDSKSPNFPLNEATSNLDNIFKRISTQLFLEYLDICHKLKLPIPANINASA